MASFTTLLPFNQKQLDFTKLKKIAYGTFSAGEEVSCFMKMFQTFA